MQKIMLDVILLVFVKLLFYANRVKLSKLAKKKFT